MLIRHVLLMDHVNVLKAITVIDVQTRARTLVKTVRMAPSAQCDQLVDTVHCVNFYVTAHVIS